MRHIVLLILFFLTAASRADGDRQDLAPLLQRHLERTKFPSFVAAVVRGSNIVAAGALGLRKAGGAERATINDKYHIGSCTKSITALLAVYLANEGVIHLTNRVTDVLSNWNLPKELTPITLEMLLQNRSGIGNKPDEKTWGRAFSNFSSSPQGHRRRFLIEALGIPLETEPGTKYIYSNTGYALAGAMIEKCAGKSWEKLVGEKIFEPLSLKSGGFGPPSVSGEEDQPLGHSWEEGKAQPKEPSDNPKAIAPAGAVHMSILDCARYAAFHLQVAQGKVPALNPHRRSLYEPPKGSSYALGWVVEEREWAGGKAITHAGSNTMFFTVIWVAPEKDFACVVATNVGDRGDHVATACDAVVGDLIERFIR